MYVYNFVSYNINYNYNQLGLANYLMIAAVVVVVVANISFRTCLLLLFLLLFVCHTFSLITTAKCCTRDVAALRNFAAISL